MEIENTSDTRSEKDIRDRIETIFENYSLDELLEMNDLTAPEAFMLLYMDGYVNEPEAFFP